jgi:hypothetical protein
MKRSVWRCWLLGAGVAALAAIALPSALGAASASAPPKAVLVELFTSQGCSSCPKANAVLGQLSSEPNTIALTYAVGYWDYLGWKDTFARPEFADRQKQYAQKFRRGVYTPQMIIDGQVHNNAQREGQLRQLISLVSMTGHVKARVARDGERGELTLVGAPPQAGADIWLAQYNPGPLYVEVKKGENAGLRMPHYNVVTKLTRVGEWTGGAKTFAGSCEPACAFIVQERNMGRVVTAKALGPADQGLPPTAGGG